jgi:hypothetical protein
MKNINMLLALITGDGFTGNRRLLRFGRGHAGGKGF